jgi:hypothetical protein
MIRKLKAVPRWAAVIVALAVTAGLGLLVATQASAAPGAAAAVGSGPYFAQGTVVNYCINLLHENEGYFELHSSELGNCAGGYEQISLSADPDGYAVPSGTAGTADIVTVGYPGAQTATESAGFDGSPACTTPPAAGTGLQLSATSSEGHSVSWALSSSPAGLAGAGELTINTATGCISGTPEVTGTYDLTATATDTTGASGSTTFAITIS